MLVISLSLFHKPGTRRAGLTGRFQKSFDINNWHLLRKGEKTVTNKESGKRILGLATDGKRECIFSAKDVAENVRV